MSLGESGRRVARGLLVAAWLLVACGEGGVEPGPGEVPVATVEQAHARGPGATRWVRRSTNDDFNDELSTDLAVDRQGNVIVSGSYTGAPDLGGGPLPSSGRVGAFGFLAKYAPDGDLLWVRVFGPESAEPTAEAARLDAAVVDKAGRITVMGATPRPMRIDGRAIQGPIFMAQFHPDGRLLWARSFGREAEPFINTSLYAQPDGDVFLVGGLNGTVDFGGGSRTTSRFTAFIARYSSDGRLRWDRVFETTEFSQLTGITSDSEGQLYAVGSFIGSAHFGGPLVSASGEGRQSVVVKYSPSGAHRWTREVEVSGEEAVLARIDVHGNRVVASGLFEGTLSFAGDTLTSDTFGSGLLVAFTRKGEERWARMMGSGLLDLGMDHQDNVTVTGVARPGQDVGTGPIPGPSSGNFFVMKLDRVRGTTRWVRVYTSELGGYAPVALAVTRDGEVAVSGSFEGFVDFGTGVLPRASGRDVFVLRLWP